MFKKKSGFFFQMKFSPFILIIFTQKLGSSVNAQSRKFFFFIIFLHVSRTDNVPSFSRNSRFGCFFSIGRTEVAFSSHFKFHCILRFLEGVIVLLPCLEHIFGHAFIYRIRILDFFVVLIKSRNGIRCLDNRVHRSFARFCRGSLRSNSFAPSRFKSFFSRNFKVLQRCVRGGYHFGLNVSCGSWSQSSSTSWCCGGHWLLSFVRLLLFRRLGCICSLPIIRNRLIHVLGSDGFGQFFAVSRTNSLVATHF